MHVCHLNGAVAGRGSVFLPWGLVLEYLWRVRVAGVVGVGAVFNWSIAACVGVGCWFGLATDRRGEVLVVACSVGADHGR